MLRQLTRWIDTLRNSKEISADDDMTLREATAGLLIEICRADFEIGAEEQAAALRILKTRFSLADAQAEQALALALDESERSTSIHALLELLNRQLNLAAKTLLVEDLWAIAYADNRIDTYEEHQIRRIADLLYVPHQAYIRAKLKAAEFRCSSNNLRPDPSAP
jgi:uncharacterized tellurite resistance protein B-like protein